MEKKLDGNYTRMLRAILNMSWRQHPTKQQLHGYLPPITKTIQGRRTRHAGHCWRSGDELRSDIILWIPSHGQVKAGRPARTCIQQLCEVTGCGPEDLPEAMNNMEEWWERVRDIRVGGTTRWWWWWFFRWSLMIFIINDFRTMIFIFIISITFRSICPPTFSWWLSNSGIYTELRTCVYTRFYRF